MGTIVNLRQSNYVSPIQKTVIIYLGSAFQVSKFNSLIKSLSYQFQRLNGSRKPYVIKPNHFNNLMKVLCKYLSLHLAKFLSCHLNLLLTVNSMPLFTLFTCTL